MIIIYIYAGHAQPPPNFPTRELASADSDSATSPILDAEGRVTHDSRARLEFYGLTHAARRLLMIAISESARPTLNTKRKYQPHISRPKPRQHHREEPMSMRYGIRRIYRLRCGRFRY